MISLIGRYHQEYKYPQAGCKQQRSPNLRVCTITSVWNAGSIGIVAIGKAHRFLGLLLILRFTIHYIEKHPSAHIVIWHCIPNLIGISPPISRAVFLSNKESLAQKAMLVQIRFFERQLQKCEKGQ